MVVGFGAGEVGPGIRCGAAVGMGWDGWGAGSGGVGGGTVVVVGCRACEHVASAAMGLPHMQNCCGSCGVSSRTGLARVGEKVVEA